MAKRLHEDGRRWRFWLLPFAACCSCVAAYLCISPFLHNSLVSSRFSSATPRADKRSFVQRAGGGGVDGDGCCRGMEHTELWSDAVNWGSDFLVNSTQDCCDACKANRKCNSWVYCAEPAKCGSFYRQCWLKRQKDPLNPDVHDSASSNPWTSGLLFDEDIGIVGLTIESGALKGQVIHMKLLPDCSPQSVMHILELAKLIHCQGCCFYRAEGRGQMWDSDGSHISKMGHGPPYALLQGRLASPPVSFRGVSRESCPAIRRGMVGWVGEGPDFFISLAEHAEWPRKHTVFATVREGDMALVEKLAEQPTTGTTWDQVDVQVLDHPVQLNVHRPPAAAATKA